jgi:teichuronic acid biosynthesis glycosyltransferase TuaG
MHEKISPGPLVSIVIPYYNAGPFIKETITAVLKQSYSNLEIFTVNDGSTDNSQSTVKEINDVRVKHFSKPNSGVSDTRNFGLRIASGEYVLFLDADDVLASDFIEKKLDFLVRNPEYDICSSHVLRINEDGQQLPGKMMGVSGESAVNDILLYDASISTCPSIYLIRKKALLENKIKFNTALSSSADRYFLIELLKQSKSGHVKDGAELYYRVHPRSMTGSLTIGLMNDNKMYLRELKKNNYIPPKIKKQFYFKIYYIFAGSYFNLKKIIPCIYYSCIAVYFSPVNFVKNLLNKVK